MHKLELVRICVNPRGVMLGLLFAFSSPVSLPSGGGGMLLWRKLWEFSCPGQFVSSDTQAQLPNLLMNNTSSAEQSLFLNGKRKGVWKHLVYSSHGNVCVLHFFDSVCVCVSNAGSTRRGESEPCQVQNSQIWALSGCVDVTVQNPPTFPCFPPSIWTPGGGSFFLRLSTSCTVSKRDLDLFLLDLHLSSKSARSQSIPALRVHRLFRWNTTFHLDVHRPTNLIPL